MWPPTLLPLKQTFGAPPGNPRARYSPGCSTTMAQENPRPMKRNKAELPILQATLYSPPHTNRSGVTPPFVIKSTSPQHPLRACVILFRSNYGWGAAGVIWHKVCRWWSGQTFCLFPQNCDLALTMTAAWCHPARFFTGLTWSLRSSISTHSPNSSPAKRDPK